MKRIHCCLALCLSAALASVVVSADPPAKRQPKEALQAFQDFIGTWRGIGQPEGSRDDKQKGFWIETQNWEWRFKGDEVWLQASIDKGKFYDQVELRYLADKDLYQLSARTPDKETQVFEGPLKAKTLTLERTDAKTKELQRLTVNLLHSNRFVYRFEVKPADKTLYTKMYQVGATKEGVPFAGPGDNRPECIVSGGLGTMAVSYKGQTYYVCCSGCRTAFNDEPEKYIKEFNEKKKKEGK